MLPKEIYYKRETIKIRYIGRKESQDLDCIGMFIPADNEILIYKNQSMKNVLITFLHELYHLLCSKDGINVSKCGEEKLVDKFFKCMNKNFNLEILNNGSRNHYIIPEINSSVAS